MLRVGFPLIVADSIPVPFGWSVSLLSLFASFTTVDRGTRSRPLRQEWNSCNPLAVHPPSPRAGLRRLSGKLYTRRDRITAGIIPLTRGDGTPDRPGTSLCPFYLLTSALALLQAVNRPMSFPSAAAAKLFLLSFVLSKQDT
jgi:hypothetical protein